ncbi:Peroxidase 40 [Turnera subulata]|uniref:Peroxidase n=1 Tax=Turnera subulata TaxID=218843 RepID=A0A9Q0GBD9_9ROSI|nr:Peroxidase 40 [Turnera subulata]
MLKLATAFAMASTLNETCIDDIGIGIVLEFNIYQESCPDAEAIIFSSVQTAISEDPRMAASLLRLHFHDCFGCDASVLLDDTENFEGEKTAPPNLNSLRGFDVIDAIKSDLESVCPETVSCADILAVVARDSVVLSGGPSWEVQMGRRDSLTASKAAATSNIPAPNSTVEALLASFQNVGLTLNDMVALSGAHTIGKARCSSFTSRFQSPSNAIGPDINLDFVQSLQQLCSESNSAATLAHLDLVTPSTFDNQYYVNLLSGEGLLQSDQVLVSENDQTRQIVEAYVEDPFLFFEDFKNSMLRMGSLGPLTGNNGEVRKSCRIAN